MATPDESQSLLSDLRGIHVPPPPDDDTGFIIFLLIALAAALALLIYSLIKRLGQTASWKHKAILSLTQIRERLVTQAETSNAALTQAAVTLRQTIEKQTGFANNRLTGQRYLSTLDQTFKTDFFTSGAGKVFGESIYRSNAKQDEVLSAIDGLSEVLRNRRS